MILVLAFGLPLHVQQISAFDRRLADARYSGSAQTTAGLLLISESSGSRGNAPNESGGNSGGGSSGSQGGGTTGTGHESQPPSDNSGAQS